MTGWTRRRFLGGAAAAVCVGCSGDDDPAVFVADARPLGTGEPSGELPGLTPLVEVGPLADVAASVEQTPTYVPEARAWLVGVAESDRDAVLGTVDERLHDGVRAGLLALYQKCPHLGCRVPFCESSGWFECPCHGSKYTRLGEHRDGPGPRGMDAFVVRVDDGTVSIDRGEVIEGLPVGTVAVDQPTTGPACVGAAGER